MSEDHREIRHLLGAYLLGGLEPADRDVFEAHLPDCPSCRDELSRSASLPGLLRRAAQTVQQPSDELAAAADARQHRLLTQLTARRLRRRRRTLLGVVAAAVLAAALVVTPALLRPPATPATAAVVELRPTTSGATGTGTALLDPRPWGTSVTLTATGLPATGPFTLEITDRSGGRERAASWGTTADGHVQVTGATSVTPQAISLIQIVGPDGVLTQSP